MNTALLALLSALQIADVLTTNAGLRAGAWEGNPLMAWAQAALGPDWWLVKVALVCLAMAVFARRRTALLAAVAGYAWVVVGNAGVIG